MVDMHKLFNTWKCGNVKFLAMKTEYGTFHIIGDNGFNYGAWDSIERFQKERRRNSELSQAIAIIDECCIFIKRSRN